VTPAQSSTGAADGKANQPVVDSALTRLVSSHRSVPRSNGASRSSRRPPKQPKLLTLRPTSLWLTPHRRLGECSQASLSRVATLLATPRQSTCGKPRGVSTCILKDGPTAKPESLTLVTLEPSKDDPRTIYCIHIKPNPEGGAFVMSTVYPRKGTVPKGSSPRQHEVDGGGSQTRACNHSHLAYPHPLQRRGLFVCRASPPHWPKPMNPLPFCARLGAFESSTSQHSLRATGWSPPKP